MERKSLIPFNPNQGGLTSASFGEVQPSGFVTRVTFGWQSKLFQIGAPEDGRFEREITFEPIFRFSGIKRNFENDYDPNNKDVRPTCYSLDGKTGSVPSVERVLADGNTHSVYGACSECAFNQWRSRGLWKPIGSMKPNEKAKQCNQYTLILARYKGEVIMIQVPSTGVESVNTCIQQVVAQKEKQFEEIRWSLMGTGAGFQGKYMKAAPMGFLTTEEIEELNKLRAIHYKTFEQSVFAFAQGGSEEATGSVTPQEGNVIDG